jgi:hypothetical protein
VITQDEKSVVRGEKSMDATKVKNELRTGNITEEYINFLKNQFITEILRGENQFTVSALVAYAHFLNRNGINSDNYPLYLKIFESNNRYAIDALLDTHDLEHYLDCVAANSYIVKNFFTIFSSFKRNEIYEKTLRVMFGFLMKVYESPEAGYRLYQPEISDINNLGKILDDTRDQDDELNRDILDILMYISDLDTPHTTDPVQREVARQAGRIRSDFFDHKRTLNQAIVDSMLERERNVSFGIAPKYIYVDG